MRIVFMGTPQFAVPSLEYLIYNHNNIVAVYTRPDRPVGRGRVLVPSPIKEVARQRQLSVFQTDSFSSAEAISQLANQKPDVIVVAAFGQILPQSVLDIPVGGCINIHPSLLPKHRGASPVAAAILAGDEFSGVTIMLMDSGLDTGPILIRAAVAISSRDNTGSLTGKLALVGAHLLQGALSSWLRHEIVPRPQNKAEATYSALIKKGDGEIDWRLKAAEIWRQVRAFYPWPGCYTRWQGKQLKILEAEPSLEVGVPEAGRVLALPGRKEVLGVSTGEGVLVVRRVQFEGKRAMPAAEFARGQRNFIGAVLLG